MFALEEFRQTRVLTNFDVEEFGFKRDMIPIDVCPISFQTEELVNF